MGHLADLLFEAKFLKEVPRSGFQFLGGTRESVAEHSYMVTFIAYVLSRLSPDADPLKLISLCLVHDLPEARTGDLNYVQKKYVSSDETLAVRDLTEEIAFGDTIAELIQEFNKGESIEARLAHDADQLGLILELKDLIDRGYHPAEKWLPHVKKRLQTELGKALLKEIMETERDAWWLKNYIDSPEIKK